MPDPRSVYPETTSQTAALLERMCAKDPAQRYQTPQELLDDMDRVINGNAPLKAAPRQASVEAIEREGLEGEFAEEPVERPVLKALLFGIIGVGVALLVGASYLVMQPPVPLLEPSTVTTTATTLAQAAPIVPDTSTSVIPDQAPSEPSTAQSQSEGAQDQAGNQAGAAQKEPEKILTPEQLLFAAEKYATEHSGNYEEIILSYKRVLMRDDKSESAGLARQQIIIWQNKWIVAAKDECGKRQKTAAEHLQAGRFTEAAQLWDEFPDSLRAETITPAIEEQVKKVVDAVNAVTDKFVSDSKALLARKPDSLTPEEAQTLRQLQGQVSSPHALLSDERKGSLAAMATSIANHLDAYEDAVSIQRERYYQLFWRRYLQAMKSKKFDEAADLAAKSAAQAGPAALAKLQADAVLLKNLFSKAEANLKRLEGQQVRLGGIVMQVSSVREGRLYVKEGDAEMAFGPERLDAKQLLDLALADEADVKRKAYQNAVFQYYYGTTAKIEESFEEAKLAGADVSHYESTLVPLLVVSTRPSGATVKIVPPIKGAAAELQTPLKLKADKNTTYTLKFSMDEYEDAAKEIRVGLSGEHSVDVTLRKVAQAQFKSILVWGSPFADRDGEHRRAVEILRDRLGERWKVEEDFSPNLDSNFVRRLLKCRALVIPEMEQRWNEMQSRTLATQFKSFVEPYCRRGGNVVFLGIHNQQLFFLSQAGIPDLETVGSTSGGPVDFTSAGSKLARSIGKSFIASNSTDLYRIPVDSKAVSFAKTPMGSAIVARKVGAGWIIVIGMDYFNDNEGTQKVLANAAVFE